MKEMRYAERLFAPCTSNYSYFITNIVCWFQIFFKKSIGVLNSSGLCSK